MKIQCPHCDTTVNAETEHFGKNVECPSCTKDFIVSEPQIKPTKTKECPYCSEQILQTAKKCKHCGEFLDESLRPSAQPAPKVFNHNLSNIPPEIDIAHGSTSWRYFMPWLFWCGFVFVAIIATVINTENNTSTRGSGGLSFMPILLLAVIFIIMLKYSQRFKLTSRRIMVINGLFVKNETEVRLKDIRVISVTRGLMNALTGTASVEIATAGTAGTEIKLRNIANAKNLKNRINSLVHDTEE